MIQNIDQINDTISIARRLLFRYAPDTELILGFCKFKIDESVKTAAYSISNGHVTLSLNPIFVSNLLPHELSVILYIEAVRLALGHVTTRLYRDMKTSLMASDMICMRMGMRTDIGKNNVIYGKINERVMRMEDAVKPLYRMTYHGDYDYRKVSLEILYRLLQKKGAGNNDATSNENGENKSENNDSPLADYINDTSRADNWGDDKCLSNEIKKSAVENGTHWGNEDINGVLHSFLNQNEKIDFKSLIRYVIHKNTPYEKEESRMRRNRRFGLLYPGYRNTYKSNILIACDISSSVGISYVSSVVDMIFKTGKNLSVDYCWWNTACTEPKTFNRKEKSKGNLTAKCGGGTDCNCVFRMLDKCKTKYDAVIIVTDFEFDFDHLKFSKRYNKNRFVWITLKPDIEKPFFVKRWIPLNDILM